MPVKDRKEVEWILNVLNLVLIYNPYNALFCILFEKSELFGFGGSMFASIKLKGIDGGPPQNVGAAA